MSDWSELEDALRCAGPPPEGSKSVAQLTKETGAPRSAIQRVLKQRGYETGMFRNENGRQERFYWPKK